ncbi:MAG: hypothetical protein AAB966_05620 [Patescibacteria group bacterium]
MDIQIILTSALVSSLFSGVFLIFNDWLRRRSEEKRIMLETAIKLTELRNEQTVEIIKRTSKKVLWPAPLNTFEKTFRAVEDIWKGKYKKSDKAPLEA